MFIRYIQSADVGGDLLFANAEDGRIISNPGHMRDVEWDSWTNVFGWPVQGLYNWPDDSGVEVTAVHRAGDGKHIVGADRWGCRCCTHLLVQSALQHSVLGVWSSASDLSWIQLLSRPYPKEGAKLAEATDGPTAHFE